MRLVCVLIVAFLSAGCSFFTSFYNNTGLYGARDLTKQEMYEDYDHLTTIIEETCPFISVNRQVFGLDILDILKQNRVEIENISSDFDFFTHISKTIKSLQSHHLAIITRPVIYYWETGTDSIIQTGMYYDDLFSHAYGYDGDGSLIIFGLRTTYIDGEYYMYDSMNFLDPPIPAGSRLLSIDGTEPNSYINNSLYFSPYLRYDQDYNQFYDGGGGFIHTLFQYDPGNHVFVFRNTDGVDLTLNLASNRFTAEQWEIYLLERESSVYWGENPYYFSNQKTLYILLQMMNRDVVRKMLPVIGKSAKGKQIDRIIIDIRNNPGGSDSAWKDLLSYLMAEDLYISNTTGILDSPTNRKYYPGIVRSYSDHGEYKTYDFLDGTTFLVEETEDVVSKRTDGLQYTGPIYLVADNYYSAAGSMASFALQHEQILLVGRPQGTHLGYGIDPAVFTLPNSLIIFQLETVIDLTGAESAADILHDQVEAQIPLNIDQIVGMFEYTGDRYSEEYLFSVDPYITYVMELP